MSGLWRNNQRVRVGLLLAMSSLITGCATSTTAGPQRHGRLRLRGSGAWLTRSDLTTAVVIVSVRPSQPRVHMPS
jgi:hypothetical protein